MMVMGCERSGSATEKSRPRLRTRAHLIAAETLDVGAELGCAVKDDRKLDGMQEGSQPLVVFCEMRARDQNTRTERRRPGPELDLRQSRTETRDSPLTRCFLPDSIR